MHVTINIDPELQSRLRARAEAQGLGVDAYVERLVRADQDAVGELEALALEGLNSGPPVEPGPDYWDAKHRLLDERLRRAAVR